MKVCENRDQSWVLGRRALIAFVFCAEIGCLFGSGTQPAIAPKQTPSYLEVSESVFRKNLTLSERVTYQKAIEEVYGRHRIWPKQNPARKPSLDAVITQAGLEKKVQDYLHELHLVAKKRGPISASELQAEVDRMARDTKQPELLRELFEALGNDPLVVAECLAKPILVDRYLNNMAGFTNSRDRSSNSLGESMYSADPTGSIHQNVNFVYKLPEISAVKVGANDTWTPTTNVNAPAVRAGHTAVWTGSEMIIWAGGNDGGEITNTGARYFPSTDSWVSTSVTDAPLSQNGHSAVWTGSEMIVWGKAHDYDQFNTGSKYNPVTDAWGAITTTNAPGVRGSHSVVWTGSEMIVWGGWRGTGVCGSDCLLNSGGRYKPETDTWSATSTINAPAARSDHQAIWTGSEMIVWGGTDQMNYLQTGGRYDPVTDSWTPTSLTNAPPGRIGHAAIWTGSQMIVWGGVDVTFQNTNTGGKYNPATDSWILTNLTNAPAARHKPTAVWTGSEMMIWGGHSASSADFNTGGRYNPATNSWTPTTTANTPMARGDHTAVWTGSEMIVWGGISYDMGYAFLNTGGCYSAEPSTPTLQGVVSRKEHSNAGDLDINLPLSGAPGIECRSGGATNDYTIVATFLANVSINAIPQAIVTSGIGTIGSGGASNSGAVSISGNVVSIPLTNVANAQTIDITLNNVNGSTNVTIPMRILVGDVNGNGTVNASDVALTKTRVGQAVNTTNFRADVNCNGAINASDVSMVKAMVGTAAP